VKKLRVIIADEEPISSSLLKSSLSYWGCDVLRVHNEEEARTALQAGNVDICILNWDLIGLNCLNFCHWIRQAELKLEPHIIVLMEKTSPESVRAAYVAGVNDYLTKPFRIEDLRSRISAVAARVSQMNSVHWQVGRLDPLECYRMDLAFHTKARSHV
jgi:DNA-binding response OmpR family regulator